MSSEVPPLPKPRPEMQARRIARRLLELDVHEMGYSDLQDAWQEGVAPLAKLVLEVLR